MYSVCYPTIIYTKELTQMLHWKLPDEKGRLPQILACPHHPHMDICQMMLKQQMGLLHQQEAAAHVHSHREVL